MPQINRRRSYTNGYARVPNWVIRDVMSMLTASEMLVYLTIVRLERRQADGHEYAFVSNDKLAEWTGANLRTVRRAVDRILALGLIEQIGQGRQRQASRYVVVTKRPLESDIPVRVESDIPVRLALESDIPVRDTPVESDTQTPLLIPMHREESSSEPEGGDDDGPTVADEAGWWLAGRPLTDDRLWWEREASEPEASEPIDAHALNPRSSRHYRPGHKAMVTFLEAPAPEGAGADAPREGAPRRLPFEWMEKTR